MSFFWEKEGIYLPSPIVLITCIKTLFSLVVFLGSYNFCDVVFYIICHDVLNQLLCTAHVWWVTIKTYLLTDLYFYRIWILYKMSFRNYVTVHWAYLVQLIIRSCTAIRKCSHLSELVAVFLLSYVELWKFPSDISHLVRLQWHYLLLDANSQLLRVVPLLR